jgi:hypothetical protein
MHCKPTLLSIQTFIDVEREIRYLNVAESNERSRILETFARDLKKFIEHRLSDAEFQPTVCERLRSAAEEIRETPTSIERALTFFREDIRRKVLRFRFLSQDERRKLHAWCAKIAAHFQETERAQAA